MSLHKQALEALRTQIKASTSSMTSVPKPLKFLRMHLDELKSLHEQWTSQDNKVNSDLQNYCFGPWYCIYWVELCSQRSILPLLQILSLATKVEKYLQLFKYF